MLFYFFSPDPFWPCLLRTTFVCVCALLLPGQAGDGGGGAHDAAQEERGVQRASPQVRGRAGPAGAYTPHSGVSRGSCLRQFLRFLHRELTWLVVLDSVFELGAPSLGCWGEVRRVFIACFGDRLVFWGWSGS